MPGHWRSRNAQERNERQRELADKPQCGRPVKNTMPSRHQASKAELDEPIHLPGRSPEDVAQVVMQGGAPRREPEAIES